MKEPSPGIKKILITGGTSGLGQELVQVFLEKGYHVVTTGRREFLSDKPVERLSYYRVDFSDLGITAHTFMEIAKAHEFDLVINNAGILSPSKHTLTKDGLEYTFQVNFLAHLLVNEIIIERQPATKPLRIATISSPVYRLAKLDIKSGKHYWALIAYSNSKLYQALMCSHLPELNKGKDLKCISFNPGVFGSGIYRMQSRFFSFLYRIAAPFMRKPVRLAAVLAEILTREDVAGGVIYNLRKKARKIPVPEKNTAEIFWKECQEKINPFLQ
ncbi:MAG: SDR family NAD(P)-dependent oxidoreductase [Bacteroidia bacterium]|nr:SDR family NAD(P)-dependent oxidoreductase [Bacteroidia bacterium]